MTTLGLKNINMLSKEQYDGVAEPATDELWAVETETYSDDNGYWYRVYPDGWCEQGGQTAAGTSITVTLLKPYRNAKYNVQLTCVDKASADQNWSCSSRTPSSFVYSNGESFAVNWRACGYIA